MVRLHTHLAATPWTVGLCPVTWRTPEVASVPVARLMQIDIWVAESSHPPPPTPGPHLQQGWRHQPAKERTQFIR